MAPKTGWGTAPTLDDIAAMAAKAVETLEEPFRSEARTVAIKVEDYPDEETLDTLKIEDPLELTGLYAGAGMRLELHDTVEDLPGRVWLYRMPILFEWTGTSDITLEDLVAHVVIHELGHHFGWSDEEIDEINEGED
jgi:predicted Zn-dependent protease with MMP-like domain